jgi:adenylate kinase family enzyme
MQRVLVIGSGGAGKSHFARALGARTGLPVTHLDELYWRPGWVPEERDAWAARIATLLASPVWILDGNFGGTLAQRLAACDTVVFLDVPRLVCLRRVLLRWWNHRGRSRPDMAPDCPERLDVEFVRWILTYPEARRPAVLKQLADAGPAVRVVRLRSTREGADFLAASAGSGPSLQAARSQCIHHRGGRGPFTERSQP